MTNLVVLTARVVEGLRTDRGLRGTPTGSSQAMG
jgi:hypothetical protein